MAIERELCESDKLINVDLYLIGPVYSMDRASLITGPSSTNRTIRMASIPYGMLYKLVADSRLLGVVTYHNASESVRTTVASLSCYINLPNNIFSGNWD